MKVADLAKRCAEAGMPSLTAQTLYKLIGQRANPDRPKRPISIDELLVLAYVLDIAPVHLIVGLDEDENLPVSPDWSVSADGARMWIRGQAPMSGGDPRRYELNRPPSEANATWFMLSDARSVEAATAAIKALQLYLSMNPQGAPLNRTVH